MNRRALQLSTFALFSFFFSLAAAKAPLQTAYFAAGCFWSTESGFEKLAGVTEVVSGYMGGTLENPTYEDVLTETTGHRETVEVRYDPDVISYEELLHTFWRLHDPSDAGGAFYDRGESYTSAIFYQNEAQQQAADGAKAALELSAKFDAPIATTVAPAGTFYPAETYHQDYAQKNPEGYAAYRTASGRDAFFAEVWAGPPALIISLAFIVLLSVVNFIGITESVVANLAMTVVEVTGLVIVMIVVIVVVEIVESHDDFGVHVRRFIVFGRRGIVRGDGVAQLILEPAHVLLGRVDRRPELIGA